MNKKQRKNLIRILLSAFLLIMLHFLPLKGIARFFCYLVPYGIVGYDVLRKAWKGIVNRQPFDESLLMAVATIGAIALALKSGSGDYTEAVAVMLFYQIGEWFQSYAVGKSRRNISELMDIRPDFAMLETDESAGAMQQVDPDEVEIGSVIVVKPGEKVPIDGIVLSGSSSLNASALTGESVPRDVKEGDEVISGCINLTGVLRIQTTKEFGESTVSKILDLVENASSRKSSQEDFITRFARVYTPAVVISALLLALLPPVFGLVRGMDPAWGKWVYRALTFLVISCPCALVISIPLGFFAGIGGASHAGILVKGSNYLEMLSKTRTIVFDKTGTLTRGVFEVTDVHHNVQPREELLEKAALAESASSHPISTSIRKALGKEPDLSRVRDIQEQSGYGVQAVVDGEHVAVGNERWMQRQGAEYVHCHEGGTVIHVAQNGAYAGHILISDTPKETSREAIRKLKENGVRKTVMLTGDDKSVAEKVGKELGIDEVYASLLPQDKVSMVEKMMSEGETGILAFAGDGINDAPVLARADIGIAMGAMGSDAAIEAADIVLMDDDPLKIVQAIRISRKCLRIVYENIWFAIGVKLVCLLLGALGIANMWLAIFADVGVMILAVLNALRALWIPDL
ncbi:MAG: cadmium-translocating P-type ATPase [Lachnospiraceae bacterium]|nr:cadmium-translocating P-type ATPase [Lachnospiraceae bacterium]